MKRLLTFFRHEVVLSVSLAAALLSFLLTPPAADTLAAIDVTTLCMLFSLMTVVAGLRRIGVFDKMSVALTRRVTSLRGVALTLTLCCFFLSMVATNDVALLTFVPFTLMLLAGVSEGATILTVVLETIAANLGSMVTPIGNPQNLFLYSTGRLNLMDFPRLTWVYALVSLVLLLLATLLLPRLTLTPAASKTHTITRKQITVYMALALAALLGVAKVVPAWAVAAAVLAVVLATDAATLKRVDFALLATFVCFFVFSGNIKGYAPLRQWLEGLMGTQPCLVSLLASQVISNVPACLLLAPFTQDAASLMLGVNLGGLGTLVASLASLISFKLYAASPTARKGRYFGVFTLLNVLMLGILLGVAALSGVL